MELSVFERLVILNLDTLPKAGSIFTLKIKQKLITDVGFSEDEVLNLGLREENGQVVWNNETTPVEIEIGPEAIKMLISAFEKSDNIVDAYVPFYDRLKEVK